MTVTVTPTTTTVVGSDDEHSGSLKYLISTGQVLSTRSRTPCTTTRPSVVTHCSMYDISCELVFLAVPSNSPRNVTAFWLASEHSNA